MLVDRPVSIRFADAKGNSIFVRRLFLDLYQPNYSLKEHLVNPADQLRQDSLARLQTVLPFSDRPVQGAVPVSLVGARSTSWGCAISPASGTTRRGPASSSPARFTSTECRRSYDWTLTLRAVWTAI